MSTPAASKPIADSNIMSQDRPSQVQMAGSTSNSAPDKGEGPGTAEDQSTNTGLNVIALISGGKDSLYSLLHILRNGHRIVALANMYPPGCIPSTEPGTSAAAAGEDETETGEEEDMDSFMYQTIGHSVIPLYSEALGIPLYRGVIRGGAVDSDRVYERINSPGPAPGHTQEGGEEDETESLIPLLQRIKTAHPEADAISAGAILSTYQRTRVESVAGRLGLTPLAWLWMYPFLPAPVERAGVSTEAGLLEDMAAAGCSARIIKVASGGLDEGVLWGDVSDSTGGATLRGRIVKAMGRFTGPGEDVRGAVLGEGGEYETLAVDGPGYLWKKRIVVGDVWVCRGEGGVAFCRLKEAKCVDKEEKEEGAGVGLESVRRPGMLDGWFEGVLGEVVSLAHGEDGLSGATERLSLESGFKECEMVQTKNPSVWTISNMTAPEAGPDAGAQMEAIASMVQTMLTNGQRSADDIAFATVLLHSMGDFALVNGIYSALFKRPNPPARATVACGDTLPDGVKIMISVVVDMGPRDMRQGLHVQSRSYWAPANIGPYSQAMSIPQGSGRVIYVAGQIPLEPASMEIIGSLTGGESWMDKYTSGAVLSLQHMWRIGTAMQVDWWLGTVAFLTGDENIDTKVRLAWHIWEKMHTRDEENSEDDEPVLDAWDIKYGGRAEDVPSKTPSSNLPNFDVVQSEALTPPFLAVQVQELPRGSDIEWQGLGCRHGRLTMAAEETDYGRRIDSVADGEAIYTFVEVRQTDSVVKCLQHVVDILQSSHAVLYTSHPIPRGVWPGQVVPCKAVCGREGRRLAAGIMLQQTTT